VIDRLYVRHLLSFDEVALDLDEGLVVFTGPSGAGKSLLISAILSNFGYGIDLVASLCEVDITPPKGFNSEDFLIEPRMSIKGIKKGNLRYFLGDQSISKKRLRESFSPYVEYLSVRDSGGLSCEKLLGLLDRSILQHNRSFKRLLLSYKKRYRIYQERVAQLQAIHAKEQRASEHIDYLKYEIERIATINPTIGEEEQLLKVKQQLSKIDKIQEALSSATGIFQLEEDVEEVYRLLDKDASLFHEMMHQLRSDFEETEHLAEELAEIDVEEVLDRLSDLVMLKDRYGSIEEALIYKQAREEELADYQHREHDKGVLEEFIAMEYGELMVMASKISSLRQQEALEIEKRVESYLEILKLSGFQFIFTPAPLTALGIDGLEVGLAQTTLSKLSGGEFNRLRLALMASTIHQSSQKEGVLILDEIDANVSGDESIAIATMIHQLSCVYQIFAISHQPHLSAKASQHVVVTKEESRSKVVSLDEKGRIAEIARIVAGEKPTQEALEFAKRLREESA
jgi:DNA repair protein RecN (Recombination protein N)